MSKPELPEFLGPQRRSLYNLRFEELDRGRSATPTEIRSRIPEAFPEISSLEPILAKLGRLLTRRSRRG